MGRKMAGAEREEFLHFLKVTLHQTDAATPFIVSNQASGGNIEQNCFILFL